MITSVIIFVIPLPAGWVIFTELVTCPSVVGSEVALVIPLSAGRETLLYYNFCKTKGVRNNH